jgi:hypothetical protein
MYRYGAALALAALVASGCSEEHAGSLPPPVSVTPSATPTPTPTNPTSEVEAAARAYYDELTAAGKTGDTARLAGMIGAGCECAKTLQYLRGEAAAGHRFTTVYRVDAVTTHDVSAKAGFATVTLTYAPSTIVDGTGHVVRSIPGKTKVGRDLGFTRQGERWVVTRLALLGD